MLSVLNVLGTRPEAVKLAPVILELARHPDHISSRVCVTAQHREMLDQVLDLFGIVTCSTVRTFKPIFNGMCEILLKWVTKTRLSDS